MVQRKLFLAIAVVSLALLAGAGIALADGDGNVSFGIRPTKAYEDRPETFSYFSYELVAGSVMSDEALVMNSGDMPVTLKLFAAEVMVRAAAAYVTNVVAATSAAAAASHTLNTSLILRYSSWAVRSYRFFQPSSQAEGAPEGMQAPWSTQ